MEILDMKCAAKGSEIASISEIDERLITKSLGVLQEDGLYAFFLYLLSRSKEKVPAQKIARIVLKQLQEQHIVAMETDTSPEPSIESILASIRNSFFPGNDDALDQIIFAKQLLEQTLIYARYHAKALDKE